ncbi:hypothetical protein PWR63_17365 [Paraburkholderia sp. A2WS-5]|uniref:hypothetical protein n=1 Tax=unclassified Paraburkholderia TaxID=2615204 RepID=UPI003B7ECD2B
MSQALKARFKHVGIHVIDVDKLVEFYQRWFGLVKTDEGSGPVGKGIFVSSDRTEHHQIVQDEDRKITQVKSHGNSLSIYVLDPGPAAGPDPARRGSPRRGGARGARQSDLHDAGRMGEAGQATDGRLIPGRLGSA